MPRLVDLLCCLEVLLMGRKDLREGVIGVVPVVGGAERAGDWERKDMCKLRKDVGVPRKPLWVGVIGVEGRVTC